MEEAEKVLREKGLAWGGEDGRGVLVMAETENEKITRIRRGVDGSDEEKRR